MRLKSPGANIKSKKILRNGFTLVEVMIATAIIAVLALLFDRLFVLNYISYEKNKVKFELTDQAIKAFNSITPEVRGATQIITCDPNSLSFYHIQGTATTPDKITITLNTSSKMIQHQFVPPDLGTMPVTYTTAPTIKTISENVVNGGTKPIFKYFNSSGAEITPCLPAPASQASSIRLITVDLRHQSTGRYAPVNELQTLTRIQLRNLKDNL